MKKELLLIILAVFCLQFANAQKEEKKEKTTVKEKIEKVAEDLVAQPEYVDTNADKIVSDNLYIKVHPMWREKGSMIFNDYKILKANEEPLSSTFPEPDKKIAQGLVINLSTIKKPAAEKKQMVLAQVKTHLQAIYKEMGQTISAKELDDKVSSMVTGPESFTTAQGQTGELYLINDIQTQQTNYIVLLLIPGSVAGTTTFVQFNYLRYIYETNFPEDIMEWKFFVYPDEQESYIKFTRDIMKTLVIKSK